ncbi:MAG: hypothetical protein CFE38_13885 [Comamonadaceae bacterium PBBC1]|nr:MAG: hypothetical protein CFE38_13885 [Comamonadaceae bacterium PBBC1]
MFINKKSTVKKQKGAVLVELVFVTIFFLVPILFGILEFGRIFYFYQKIVHQVHQAARYLSMQAPGINYNKAKCLLMVGELVENCDGSVSSISGIAINNIKILSNQGIDANFVTVSVEEYSYNFLFFHFLKLDSIKFNKISATYRVNN